MLGLLKGLKGVDKGEENRLEAPPLLFRIEMSILRCLDFLCELFLDLAEELLFFILVVRFLGVVIPFGFVFIAINS